MGALHEGHLSLIRTSRKENELSVISIFVNPTQFGPNEDFETYPRPEKEDLEKAESCGVDMVFMPSVNDMYRGGATLIEVGPIGTIWEGAIRPGHFNGVATVVAKLFHIVRPDTAYFGQKDFQQCAVIAQMVRDLDEPVKLTFLPTLREADGLAMSSRNAYLSSSERALAPKIFESLNRLKNMVADGATEMRAFASSIAEETSHLQDIGFEVDYLELVDEHTLTRVENLEHGGRLIVAAKLGKTRLIDNLNCQTY
jgi:pantoate--beta-alanine ligase